MVSSKRAFHKPLQYARRLVRNPKKYFDRAFLQSTLKAVRWHSRMAVMYGLPYLAKCVRTRKVRNVVFFPSPIDAFLPREIYVAWKALRMCGVRICDTGSSDTDLAIAWHPSTQYDLDADTFSKYRVRHAVVNAGCTDIRKSRVDRAFEAVFGYGLPIDPLTHQGVILRKSERNGPHDAVLLDGPLQSVEEGYVYQRLVTYETPKGMAEWRAIVVAGKVASVYVNYRPVDNRFQPLPVASAYCSPTEAFSAAERENISRFCGLMGLDFGALDVLRDSDGRMYICDCNNTPTGPSEKLSRSDQLRVSAEIAREFEAAFLR